MTVRAIRGAVTVDNNTKEEIILYTKQLLKEMIMLNNIDINDMISIFLLLPKTLMPLFHQLLPGN